MRIWWYTLRACSHTDGDDFLLGSRRRRTLFFIIKNAFFASSVDIDKRGGAFDKNRFKNETIIYTLLSLLYYSIKFSSSFGNSKNVD